MYISIDGTVNTSVWFLNFEGATELVLCYRAGVVIFSQWHYVVSGIILYTSLNVSFIYSLLSLKRK